MTAPATPTTPEQQQPQGPSIKAETMLRVREEQLSSAQYQQAVSHGLYLETQAQLVEQAQLFQAAHAEWEQERAGYVDRIADLEVRLGLAMQAAEDVAGQAVEDAEGAADVADAEVVEPVSVPEQGQTDT